MVCQKPSSPVSLLPLDHGAFKRSLPGNQAGTEKLIPGYRGASILWNRSFQVIAMVNSPRRSWYPCLSARLAVDFNWYLIRRVFMTPSDRVASDAWSSSLPVFKLLEVHWRHAVQAAKRARKIGDHDRWDDSRP